MVNSSFKESLLAAHLVKVDEVSESGVPVLVHSQETIIIPRGINQEVLEACSCAIGQYVTPNSLTDSHKEAAFSLVYQ